MNTVSNTLISDFMTRETSICILPNMVYKISSDNSSFTIYAATVGSTTYLCKSNGDGSFVLEEIKW